ncbi:MAG: proline dehydrogenase family protein, partial [Pirellulales bacterium]
MLDDFSQRDLNAIEGTTREVGRYLFDHLDARQPSVLERRWWDDRIMDWAMRDDAVKVQMFRFVDVLPMLRDSRAVTEHLIEYLGQVRDRLPGPVRVALAMAKPGSVVGRGLALAARRNAAAQARRFIAGTTAEEVLAAAKRERRLRRAFTLDVLGEAVTSEIEAEQYLSAYVTLIERISPTANTWPEVPQIDRGLFAELPRMNVSVKLSALDSRFDPIDPVGTTRRVAEGLGRLLRVARQHRAFVNVDMESYRAKDLTLAIFKDVLSRDEFRDFADVGIVIQCYLRDAGADLVRLRDWAAARGTPVWVRLVKGAYWDYETTYAAASGWPVPVYQEKWQSDANFERATRYVFRHHQHLRPALGSHNLRSLAHGIATARHLGLPASGFELQMLYGMADAEKQVLVGMGHRLRIYMPYGELIPGMAYLVRRLLENTSNDSFLRATSSADLPVDALLADPLDIGQTQHGGDRDRAWRALDEPAPTIEAVVTTRERKDDAMPMQTTEAFRNEPLTDFAVESNRQAMQTALGAVRLGEYYPLWIDGRPVRTPEQFTSISPSHRQRVVGAVAKAGVEHVDRAVAAASAALGDWSARPVEERASYLRRAADAMRRRRFELAAWAVHECGKPWREADADVAEAIDFCEYYAAGAVELQNERGVDVPGEENEFEFMPRGVAAVIAPWNFPLAILTGMTVAALATGNTVVMKPAEQSSVVAAKLMEILSEVDLPAGVLNYVPGEGHVAGARLVEHPDVALIAFTGSRDVGLAINAKAAEVSARGQGRMVKHVIAEMGGKNAIIIDEDADLDEAVL